MNIEHINTNLDYLKIREMARELKIKMGELRKILIDLEVLQQNTRISGKPYLLTHWATGLGIGEIRYKPYGDGRKSAPFNIYFPEKIKLVIERNIPLSLLVKTGNTSIL